MTKIDVNRDFDTARASQILSLVQMREDHQRRIADFESGAAQAAIDAEIMKRIDAGTIEMAGPDRYRVLTGWDANETFTVRKAQNPGELSLIEPESGLDFLNGQFQGYFDRPEWHGLGNVVPGGISSVDEVMRLGGLDYDVLQRPVRYFSDSGELLTMPDNFVNYRSDTQAGLGVVGKIYTPFQNRDGAAFLQSLVDDYEAKFCTAFPLNDGRRAVITMELPEGITIDAEGVNEHLSLYLAWLNNHDGQGKAECIITPWRIRCRNTERLGRRGLITRWGTRHTKNGLERLEEARRTMGMVGDFAKGFVADEQQLLASAATMDDVLAVMAEIYPLPKGEGQEQSKRWQTLSEKRNTALEQLWGDYSNQLGRNLYAAERVVTDHLDHKRPATSPLFATAALTGEDDKDKNRAHAKLLQLAKR